MRGRWPRVAVVAGVASILLVAHGAAFADLRVSSRIDTTRTATGARVWLTNSAGSVVSRYDVPISAGTTIWVTHGAGTASARAEGLASTYYVSGSRYENVFYVGTDGKLNRGVVVDGGAITWTSFNPPTGKTLSGNIAAGTFVASSTRYLVVAATTTDSKLYRLVMQTSGSGATWTDSSGGLTWISSDRLAVTSDDTILSIFGAQNTGSERLGLVRWTGSTWTTVNLSAPPGKRVCDSISAAQGQLNSTDFRLVVACTPQTSVGEFYVATAPSASSTTFTWSTVAIPDGHTPVGVGAALRVTDLFSGTQVVDTYVFMAGDTRIRRLVISPSQGFADLGLAPEIDIYSPGVVAFGPTGTVSKVYFLGIPNNLISTGHLLYERTTALIADTNVQHYRAQGREQPNGLTWTNLYAEAKSSMWHGTTAVNMLSRPGTGQPGDWPRTYFTSSGDEGLTFVSPQLITNSVGSTVYPYVSDPTAVVTDQRLMYAVQVGVLRSTCSGAVSRASVYAVSTSNGTSFSSPIEFEAINGGPTTPIDHPYADIEHKPGAPDVIHVAWWVVGAGTIHYAALTEGSTSVSWVNLGVPSGSGGPPRVTANDAGRVIVYYGQGNQVYLCELKSDRSGCNSPGWQIVPAGFGYSNPFGGPGVSGSSVYMRAEYPISMSLSDVSDTLFYCFSQTEPTMRENPSDNDTREEMDSGCTTAVRDGTGNWVFNTTPVWLEASDDDHDQFAPEVVVTSEDDALVTNKQTAIITWYSRTDDPGNYYYKIKKTVSTNELGSVQPAIALISGEQSDPEYLPRHCADANVRFIGDYSASEGDILHARPVAVSVPSPGTIGTTLFTNFGALGRWSD